MWAHTGAFRYFYCLFVVCLAVCLLFSPLCIVASLTEPVSPLETSPVSRPGEEQSVTVKQELLSADSPTVSEGKAGGVYIACIQTIGNTVVMCGLIDTESILVLIEVKTTSDATCKNSHPDFFY